MSLKKKHYRVLYGIIKRIVSLPHLSSSDLNLILDLVARELARKHTTFYSIGFSEAKAMFKQKSSLVNTLPITKKNKHKVQKLARKWGHAIIGVFLCFWGVITRLDYIAITTSMATLACVPD